MRTLIACGVILLSVDGTNTLSTTRSIEPIGVSTQRPDCQIIQCLDSTRFVDECKAAVAGGCAYTETIIVDGEVSGNDLCVAQLQPATQALFGDKPQLLEENTILLPKLNLSLPLADPEDKNNLAYVSGAMYFTTALPNEGSSIYLRAFPSPSTACDTTYNTSATALSIGPWKKGETKIDFAKKYPKSFDASIIDGSNMVFFNSTIDVKQAGSFVGFYSTNYTLSMSHEFATNSIEYKTGTQTLSGATGTCVNGCTDTSTFEGVYECILKGPEECDMTATYTITDTVTPARGYCVAEDKKTHVLLYTLVPGDAEVSGSTGTVSLNIGSVPAENCNIQVKGSPLIDTAIGDCGLEDAADMIEIAASTIGPDNKSIQLSSIPDGVQTFVVISDKDWMYCGGGISSLSTDNLTAKISYSKRAESASSSTTEAPPETVAEDPFDTPASSGVLALLSGVSILPLLLC